MIDQVRIEKGTICGNPDNDIGWKSPCGFIVAGQDILLRSSRRQPASGFAEMRENVILNLCGGRYNTPIYCSCHLQSLEGVLQKGFSPRLEENLARESGAAHACLHDRRYGWD